MQQSTETESSARWANVITDLSKRSDNLDAEAVNLANEGDRLALDAELGIDGAAQRLGKIRAEQTKKLMAANNLAVALESAKQRHQAAQAREAEQAERQRREQLSTASKQYLAQAAKVDEGMCELALHFAAVKEKLDLLESLATGGERAPLQQLRGQLAGTLASAHHGLNEFIQLGPQAAHVQHRQPFEQFVRPFMQAFAQDAGGKKS